MLFAALILSALPILTSVLGSTLPTRTTQSQPISPRLDGGLDRRNILLNLCAVVAVDIPISVSVLGVPITLSLTDNLCICVADGALTQASLDTLTANLQNDAAINLEALGVDIDVLSSLVAQALVVILGNRPPPAQPCDYPAGSIPNSCQECSYDCPASAPLRCGNQCIAGSCVSGMPGRKRRFLETNLLCASGLTACESSNHIGSLWGRVECFDTRSDVNSCGGCRNPLPGIKKGVDCTTIDYSQDVSCEAGKCVIESCSRGHAVVGGECVAI